MNELDLLKRACDKSSQASVAKKIGYSPAVVNLVLKGTYTGDMEKVRRMIRMRLGTNHVECPVLGQIDTAECTEHQTRPFSMSNSHRVRMFKACQTCPFNASVKGV